MSAYYNENDPFSAAWLRKLIEKNLICKGDVDERSIEDIKPSELTGYTQCHFFAGIGVWSYALRQAGWPDDRPVWTGSCPCQPFSAAGKRKGTTDERHLWPSFHWLIQNNKPVVVFGEQVASKDGLAWLDIVSSDLEEADYAFGAVDICAAGVGAPHLRQRLYWTGESLADSEGERKRSRKSGRNSQDGIIVARTEPWSNGNNNSEIGELADNECARLEGTFREVIQRPRNGFTESRIAGIVGNTNNEGSQGRVLNGDSSDKWLARTAGLVDRTGESNSPGSFTGNETTATARQGDTAESASFWTDRTWLPCIDGKTRPVEPGTFPLAYGVANRVGRLRGYGNALVAPQAKAFIEAYLEVRN